MLIGTLTLALLGAPPPAGTYSIDPSQTYLLVQLRPDESRLFSGFSHRHVIRATKPKGTVSFDPSNPDACRIEVVALVRDLEVDAPAMRKKVGFDDVIDDDDREDIAENMRDKDQLYARKHSDIRFMAKRCQVVGGGRIRVQGTLTVRGVGRALDFTMQVTYERKVLKAVTEFTLTHGAFRFEPYSAGLGTLANDDWLKFTIEVVAKPTRLPRPPKTTTSTVPPAY